MRLGSILTEISELPDWAGCEVSSVASRNGYGDTPLHVAAVRGDVEMIQVLLEAGAEVDAKGEHGFTPLHDALAQGNADAAHLFLSNGASLTTTNDWGETAIIIAKNGGHPNTLALIRDAGA